VAPDQVATADGHRIDVHSTGSGPGVVVVHGSAVSAPNYARLAATLAGRFTVHRYDRRGRGSRGPVDASHGVASDVDDLRAVLEHTGARTVLAHSYGGLVALRGAAALPLDRLAVYDAAVSIDGCFPSAFVEPFAAAAADFPLAMAVLSKGLGTAGAFSRLPIPVQRVALHGFAVTRAGREWRTMLPSAVAEAREVVAHDAPAATYADVPAPVLLVTGARSPAYFGRASAALARAVPGVRHVVVPKADHNALMNATAPFVGHFTGFLSGA
jgi:pimeloyl-ACP methyl ester carboxylesterase